MTRLSVLLLLPLVLSSCMTIGTQWDNTPGPRIYSGTSAWFSRVGSGKLLELREFYAVLIVLADLPLSIVADTLILPFTIPQQIQHGDFIKFWQRVPSTATVGEQIKIKVQDARRASQTVTVLVRVRDGADPQTVHIKLDAKGNGTAIIQAPDVAGSITLSSENQVSRQILISTPR